MDEDFAFRVGIGIEGDLDASRRFENGRWFHSTLIVYVRANNSIFNPCERGYRSKIVYMEW